MLALDDEVWRYSKKTPLTFDSLYLQVSKELFWFWFQSFFN